MLFSRLGIFPWLMMGAARIFFAPDWPRRLFERTLRARLDHDDPRSPLPIPLPRRWTVRVAIAAVVLFAVVQLAMLLRHFAYPGNVRWNEEGYRFAWRVMLTEKAGFVQYRVRDANTGKPGWSAPTLT